MQNIYYVGVDVGTGSARAGLVNSKGRLIKFYVKAINTWNPIPDHYEQSSEDIWNAVSICVKNVIEGINPDDVIGIGFDATCSLVCIGHQESPISVSTTKESTRNVILWMDHRAHNEAEKINSTNHALLEYVGGKVSIEMELPKLLWLKYNMNSTYSKIWRVFDLPDFLTWKATNSDTRSLCSVVCKWNYDAKNNSWSSDFLNKIDLSELCENNFEKIGKNIQSPGMPVGNGLCKEAAVALGLKPGIKVGTSLIDAHAGALALFGTPLNENSSIESILAIIAGTSACHMSIAADACKVKGIWGPYYDAITKGYYLNEGGQSAVGALIDFIIHNHSIYKELKNKLHKSQNIYSYLNEVLKRLAREQYFSHVCYLTKHIHVWPDFHGNRSPIADPNLKGMISGLTMSANEENLALLYLATVQAIALQTRHIIEKLYSNGRPKFDSLSFCGGLSKNPIYINAHADACNIPAIVPHEKEMVLIGSAMLGCCATQVHPDLAAVSQTMGSPGNIIHPNKEAVQFYNKKYEVFLKMYEHQRLYDSIMA